MCKPRAAAPSLNDDPARKGICNLGFPSVLVVPKLSITGQQWHCASEGFKHFPSMTLVANKPVLRQECFDKKNETFKWIRLAGTSISLPTTIAR